MSQPDEGTLNHIETIQNIEKTTSADLLHLIPNQKKHKLNDDERLSHKYAFYLYFFKSFFLSFMLSYGPTLLVVSEIENMHTKQESESAFKY